MGSYTKILQAWPLQLMPVDTFKAGSGSLQWIIAAC